MFGGTGSPELPLPGFVKFLCQRWGVDISARRKYEEVAYELLKKLSMAGEYEIFMYVLLVFLGRVSETLVSPLPFFPVPKTGFILYADIFKVEELEMKYTKKNRELIDKVLTALSYLGQGEGSTYIVIFLVFEGSSLEELDRDVQEGELRSLRPYIYKLTCFYINFSLEVFPRNIQDLLIQGMRDKLIEMARIGYPIALAKMRASAPSMVTAMPPLLGRSKHVPAEREEEEESGEGEE